MTALRQKRSVTNVRWVRSDLVSRYHSALAIERRVGRGGGEAAMLARPVGKDHSRKLRACDLVTLHVDEVCSGAKVRDPATVLQKNGRPVQFETTKRKASLEVTNAPDDWLSISFPEPTN
jgi:hypothetical protein